MEHPVKKDSTQKGQDQKTQFVNSMRKLKDEGRLSEYSKEVEKAAGEQDPDWDVLLK